MVSTNHAAVCFVSDTRRIGSYTGQTLEIITQSEPITKKSKCITEVLATVSQPNRSVSICAQLMHCLSRYLRKHSVYPYSGMSHFPSVEQDLLWSPTSTKSWLHSNVTLVLGTNKKLLFRPKRGVSRTPHEITANEKGVISCYTVGECGAAGSFPSRRLSAFGRICRVTPLTHPTNHLSVCSFFSC